MSKRKWFAIFALLAVCSMLVIACEDVEDAINEKTQQTKSFDEELPFAIPLTSTDGYCTPMINFDDLLSSVSLWNDVKGHIDDVQIKGIYYTVDPNDNGSDGVINFYVTESEKDYFNGNGAPASSDKVGYTATIVAGQKVKDQEMIFTASGQERLEELMIDFEQPFRVCAEWGGSSDDVDMSVSLSVDVDVIFVPL